MPERAKIMVARFADGVSVHLEGAGTMAESPLVNAFAEEVMRDRTQRVIVDLAGCTYLDSTFLGGLVSLLKRHGRPQNGNSVGNHEGEGDASSDPKGAGPSTATGPRFAIYAPAPQRRTLFGVSRLDTILPFVDEVPPLQDETLPLETQGPASRDELATYIVECHRRLAELGGAEAHEFAQVAEALAGEINSRRRS
jgi:hypothetical protein